MTLMHGTLHGALAVQLQLCEVAMGVAVEVDSCCGLSVLRALHACGSWYHTSSNVARS